MDYMYRAKLEADPDEGFLVTFPDVPEAITHGKTRKEALDSAAEALGLALRSYLADGLPLPMAKAKGRYDVAVPAQDAMKLALIEAFNASGLSKSELARRLDKNETEARRLLDPDHSSRFSIMQAALAELGKTVIVSVRDAA
ncbi:MAG: type II toxin-antitoxin system HicB family antitoxin [Phyllobacterium sp.]